MHGVIEQIEWSQGVLVLVLNLLRRLLEAGKHGALAAGEVLAGITVLADLGKNLLHEDKLIRHKGEIAGKFPGAAETLDIQHGIGKGEQVPEHRIVGVVNLLQLRLHIVLLQQDTLLDNLIRRGGGQREAGLETRLNAGEFVLAGLDDFIHGFLTCADHPDLAAALAADVFYQRLQVDQQIGFGKQHRGTNHHALISVGELDVGQDIAAPGLRIVKYVIPVLANGEGQIRLGHLLGPVSGVMPGNLGFHDAVELLQIVLEIDLRIEPGIVDQILPLQNLADELIVQLVVGRHGELEPAAVGSLVGDLQLVGLMLAADGILQILHAILAGGQIQ